VNNLIAAAKKRRGGVYELAADRFFIVVDGRIRYYKTERGTRDFLVRRDKPEAAG
jgi:hypothetical protein